MRNLVVGAIAMMVVGGSMWAPAAHAAGKHLVEFERMTWVEVKDALAAGQTTALIYTGGVEQRGPQNANGGHNLIAYATVKAIAEKLGNAIFLPVLPYTPNEASADLPGTIGITDELLGAILERLANQAIVNGFKDVILMGDHGGGQPKVYEDVARKMNDQYSPKGIHVYYCDQVYKASGDAFEAYMAKQGLPPDEHAGVSDTSEMMYLDKDGTWVRRSLIATAVGDPVVDGKVKRGPNSPHNGISGDARRSSPELGKKYLDMKVDYAVRQIRSQIGGQ
jgi:creatinine amidohydrolase/Fe(II)-dependent formamide hydrolase-like protein